MKLCGLLILAVFASEKKENVAANDPKYGEEIGKNEKNLILVKIEEDEYAKANKKSKFIGVYYHKIKSKWGAYRRIKNGNKLVNNGSYDDEETAAHASDTLARKLMGNGEQAYILNFPGDYTEVRVEEKNVSSKFIGVSFNEKESKWKVQRWSKHEKKRFSNGCYGDEETAAHASDTLARKLMENGEFKLELNFPDDHTEIYPEEKETVSKFFGVVYDKKATKWKVQRWSRHEKKIVYGGYYDNEETAAHASDTLARKLLKNGEFKLELNFPDDYTEVQPKENQNKRKRQKKLNLEYPQNN